MDQLSAAPGQQDIPAAADFLCDQSAVLGKTIKQQLHHNCTFKAYFS
jgi:hypothetical protein